MARRYLDSTRPAPAARAETKGDPSPRSIDSASDAGVPLQATRQEVDRLLLTPSEAARTLGIGRSTLYELLRGGVVPSVRIGGCRRIVAEDLHAVIVRLRDQPAPR
jgi:excisionase family DNA binding protein